MELNQENSCKQDEKLQEFKIDGTKPRKCYLKSEKTLKPYTMSAWFSNVALQIIDLLA